MRGELSAGFDRFDRQSANALLGKFSDIRAKFPLSGAD
jgi:hypothetical protein